jgi:GNAT superfamily N-acetyltransferase
VFQAAALDAWASFLGRERLAGNRQNDSQWAERIRKPGGRFLVTEDDAGIGAFAHWRLLDERTGEIDLLYTHPRAQGTGLGRRLLERATWNLLCDGCREAVLWTEARNARALAMYRHNGWMPDGAVDARSYFGAPIRNLRHRLDLTRHAGGA